MDIPVNAAFGILVLLIIFSAFFSSSETGMMAINRYRLRHQANSGNRKAQRVQKLLERPDRLIGVILIGNNFVNNFAAALATVIAIHYFDSMGVAIAPIVLTIILLIFAEVTPKTLAAYYPEKIAYPSALILRPLLWLMYPLVWLVNSISNAMLKLVNFTPKSQGAEDLSPDELRSIVNEAGGLIPEKHQKMLLNILDLETITVDDLMIPRNEVVGININDEIETIITQLTTSNHTRLPVFKGDLNNAIGVFHTRKSTRLLELDSINKAELMQLTIEPYFVPEGTPLNKQLIEFQQLKRRLGIVVDEYGDVQGIITLEDILEEIVGEFTTDMNTFNTDIHHQEDGSYIIDGTTTLREINRTLNWDLPSDAAKTLNGLILVELESIPETSMSFRLGDYLIEIIQIKDNGVKTARILHRRAAQQKLFY